MYTSSIHKLKFGAGSGEGTKDSGVGTKDNAFIG